MSSPLFSPGVRFDTRNASREKRFHRKSDIHAEDGVFLSRHRRSGLRRSRKATPVGRCGGSGADPGRRGPAKIVRLVRNAGSRVLTVTILLCLIPTVAACGGGSSSSTDEYDGPLTVPYDGPDYLPDDSPPPPGPQAGLDAQRDLWTQQGIGNYRFTLQRTVFGPPAFTDPVVVEVRGGLVASRVYEGTGLPVAPADAFWWPSIDGLFEIIQDALDRNADQVAVTYDPGRGYPTSGSIDYSLGLGDDEHSFVVRDFAVLP